MAKKKTPPPRPQAQNPPPSKGKPVVQQLGNGKYRANVNGNYYTFTATPGQDIIVGGVHVTVPKNIAVPGSLDADQQQNFNQNMDVINSNDIDLGAAHDQATTNYGRTIVDLAHNALVSAQTVEENMAARGQYDSGLRTAALVDVEQHRALAAGRALEDLQTADILYNAKHQGFANSRGQLQNWANLTMGANQKAGLDKLNKIPVPAFTPSYGSPQASPARTGTTPIPTAPPRKAAQPVPLPKAPQPARAPTKSVSVLPPPPKRR